MLKVSNIDVFHGQVQALEDVSLDVERGELVALIGGNGAGKTTMVNTICGLHHPSKGEIVFNDIRIDQTPSHKIVGLGLVQVAEGRRLFPEMSVLENLEMGAYLMPKGRISEMLEMVYSFLPKLKERKHQLTGSLSGGEQQMVAIGRALMSDPKLLILDEPSLGLSPLLVETVFERIKEINQQGVTVLLIEQNVVNSLTLANRAYILENGNMVKSGFGKDLLKDPQVKAAYMGMD